MAFRTTHGDRYDPALVQASLRHSVTVPWYVVEAAAQQQPEKATDLGVQPGDVTAAGLRQWLDHVAGRLPGIALADGQAQLPSRR